MRRHVDSTSAQRTPEIGPQDHSERLLAICQLFLSDWLDSRIRLRAIRVVPRLAHRAGAGNEAAGRLYVLDGAGKVAYKSGRGPFGFKAAEMEQALVMALLEAK